MTLYRGSAVLNGSNVAIVPPQGFGAINGLRLTNYTGETLLLNNISSTGQGEEFLFPRMQMVYHTRNISAAPTASGFFTRQAFPPNRLFVEWSDDSINDFIGVYPAFVPQDTFINPALGTPVILQTNATGTPATDGAPPNFFDYGITSNTVGGVQTAGPLTVPVGFEFSLASFQIAATYTAPPYGVQQFTIMLGEIVAGAIFRNYGSSGFVLNATILQDTPMATHNYNYNPPRIIPAGETPTWIYQNGPAGVSFNATATGVLLPV
jgi:hypothetical protein